MDPAVAAIRDEFCIAYQTEDGRLVQYTDWSSIKAGHTGVIDIARRNDANRDWRLWHRTVTYSTPTEVTP
jgi:hypothetical protein